MKLVLMIVALLLLNNILSAQGTVKKLLVPVSRTSFQKKIPIQQSITNQINKSIDSLLINTKSNELFVNNIISSIEKILDSNWRNGYLIGTKTSQAYYVQCGKQTMTQNDIENGILIVAVGIACNKPGEFELLRFEKRIIGKKIILIY